MAVQNKTGESFLHGLYTIFKKHWIWNTIILFLPSIWFPLIINQFGSALLMTYTQGGKTSLTVFGILSTLLVYLLVLVLLLLNSKSANREELRNQEQLNAIRSSYEQLNYIISCINNIGNNELNMILNGLAYPGEDLDHSKQIEIILQKIADCLANVSKIESKKINVTLAFKLTDCCKPWCWSEYSRTDGGLPLETLLSNDRTTFHQVSSGSREFIFYNSKIKAEENEHYVFDAKDKSYRNVGSIICKKINIGSSEKTYIEAVLSITTYGKKFVPDDNENLIEIVESNIRDVIIPEFELHIQIELAQIYLQKLQYELVEDEMNLTQSLV